MAAPEFKLVIDLKDKNPDDYHRVIARLLRNAADRIEAGGEFGGFAFDQHDRTGGGFSIHRYKQTSRRVG